MVSGVRSTKQNSLLIGIIQHEKRRGRKKKRIEQISKHLHPHDDEPDPTAYMGNYNFPQMLFAFCLGFVTMFVLSVNEINNFKGCPLPEYFQNESRSAPG